MARITNSGKCKECGNIIYNRDGKTVSGIRTECDDCVLNFLKFSLTNKFNLTSIK